MVLRTRDGGFLNGEIMDISAGGAFIRITDDLAKPRGLLRLEFDAPLPEQTHCEWWALVIRESNQGIGVMFDRRHNETAACRMRRPAVSVEHALGA